MSFLVFCGLALGKSLSGPIPLISSTLDQEIFIVKNFLQSPSRVKIKQVNYYFVPRINGVTSFCRVVIATKTKQYSLCAEMAPDELLTTKHTVGHVTSFHD